MAILMGKGNILFFGDSLTAGYGLADVNSESFPALISGKLLQEGYDFQVINAGLSGDTSIGGLNRIDYWLQRPVDIFVLELGINDVLRGIPPEQTSANLQAIIDRVRAKHPDARLAMMGMEIPFFLPGTFVVRFRAIFRELAKRNDMAFVPFFLEGVAGLARLNLKDGLHPSAEGYRVIADRVWPVIRSLIDIKEGS